MWWNKKCEEAIENRKKALKEFKRNSSMENWIEFKRNRGIARKTVKRKKKENFLGFVKNLNKFSNINYVWKKIGVMKDREGRKSWNGSGRIERKELIMKEVNKVAPLWVKNKSRDLNEIEDGRLRDEIVNHDFNREFRWEELGQ